MPDECDLGHQFDPADLIKPTSSLTGCVPELRPVRNWYFDLPNFREQLGEIAENLEADPEVRPVVSQTAKEFLVPPVIYIKNELEADYRAIESKLPAHEFHAAEGNKQSFELEFANIELRDAARDALTAAGIRFRTGKALVPFRISRQCGVGCEGARDGRRGRPHRMVLARKPVGACELLGHGPRGSR